VDQVDFYPILTKHTTILQIYQFRCKGCGFEIKLPLGTSDMDQILTDVNTDYAEYHLFICRKESKFVHADIHNREFEGKCSSDGSELAEIDEEIDPIRCPRCNKQNLVTETRAPLEEKKEDNAM
jgi:DNA-directed RNA polymerase subunit RPC12/RpoP